MNTNFLFGFGITLLFALVLYGLFWCVRKWYRHFHTARALMEYFSDQLPDINTLNAWFNWSELYSIKKLLKKELPTKPRRAPNYRKGN
jgi:hypothetical protein